MRTQTRETICKSVMEGDSELQTRSLLVFARTHSLPLTLHLERLTWCAFMKIYFNYCHNNFSLVFSPCAMYLI